MGDSKAAAVVVSEEKDSSVEEANGVIFGRRAFEDLTDLQNDEFIVSQPHLMHAPRADNLFSSVRSVNWKVQYCELRVLLIEEVFGGTNAARRIYNDLSFN